MVYELRSYYTTPGKLEELIARFDTFTLKLWQRFEIRPVGFWTTIIGDDNNTLFYMLKWESLAEREDKWNKFLAHPDWLKIREKTEKNGPLIAKISSQMLAPTSFSELK